MNSMSNGESISIFIPVYNEEKNIDIIVPKLLAVAGSITDNFEILLINDGSSDGSREKILYWVKNNSKIKIINHENNLGYGQALRSGFSNAEKDFVFYTDADMPVDLNSLNTVIPFIKNYDLVIGYRINRNDTLRRYIYSKIYNFLLTLLLNVKVNDANFSFKCIRKEALRKCNLKAKSVFIDGELLAEAVRNGCSIKEIPIVYIPRKHGKSNFDSLKPAIHTMRELIKYWLSNQLFKKR